MEGFITDLRPMGVGEIIDRSFRLYRRNIATFFSISLVGAIVGFLLSVALLPLQREMPAQPSLGEMLMRGGLGFAAALVSLVVGVVVGGALTMAVSERFLGRTIRAGEAYRRILPRVPTLVALALTVGILATVGFALCILPGFYVLLTFLPVSIIAVVERRGVLDAMSRSHELMRVKTEKGFFSMQSNSAKATLILLILLAFAMAQGMIVGTVAIACYIIFGGGLTPEAIRNMPLGVTLVLQAFGGLVNAFTGPFYSIPIILFYYDIRMRFEAFDLETLAAAVGGDAPEVGMQGGGLQG